MIAADEDENDEDGMSVDWTEQHPDRNKAVDERVVPNLVHRFERLTRARASNDEDGMSVDWAEQHPDRNKAVDERVVPNLVHRFERLTRARASLPRGLPKSLPGIFSVANALRTPPGLPPGPPPTSSSSSEPEKNDFVDHV